MKIRSATTAHIHFTCADPESVLKKLNACGVVLLSVSIVDELTVSIHVHHKDYKEAISILEQLQISYRLLNRLDDTASFSVLKKHAVLITCAVVIVLASIILSGRILFVSVVGSNIIPPRKIIEAANRYGLSFMTPSASIRNERIKNGLLEDIAQLQWVGVNVNGCVATIYIEEKNSNGDTEPVTAGVSSIVSATDGVIESITVTKGTKLCDIGQSVAEGEVLISGYTDCGMVIRATKAEGEVYAQTMHKTNVLLPIEYRKRSTQTAVKNRYYLRIGKNIINFNNSSGIYHGSCAKIYEEQYMMLPGDHFLPVSFIREKIIFYQDEPIVVAIPQCEQLLQDYSREYVTAHMVAGTITHESVSIHESNNCAVLIGDYICSEMIGRHKTEDILQGDK